MRPLRICLDCNGRHREDGARCRPCNLQRQKARNAARTHLYGGNWRTTSRRARQLAGRCAICGRPDNLTLDHEHGQVECRSCNSSHRRNAS